MPVLSPRECCGRTCIQIVAAKRYQAVITAPESEILEGVQFARVPCGLPAGHDGTCMPEPAAPIPPDWYRRVAEHQSRIRARQAANRSELGRLGLPNDRLQPIFASSACSPANNRACDLIHRGIDWRTR